MSETRDGFIDTNVFIHALKNDNRTEECLRFLSRVQTGLITVRLHPLVVHELTYNLIRVRPMWSREQIAAHIEAILEWPGVIDEAQLLRPAVMRWGTSTTLSFVDAYLIEAALRDDRPVYTINRRDFVPFGVNVPTPLPTGE